MPNYAGSSRKLYQNENYVCSNHNDIKNAFIPFRNKEINVCLATNSSPACCATPNLSTGRDPPPPCAEAFNSPKCGPPKGPFSHSHGGHGDLTESTGAA